MAFGNEAMDRDIARLNIEHLRKKLAEETDEAKLAVIRRLLAEEESKLARLSGGGPGKREQL